MAAAVAHGPKISAQSTTTAQVSVKQLPGGGGATGTGHAGGMFVPSDERRHCAMCHTSLGEEAIIAMNRLWHPDHFICQGCKKPIRQTFQAADNDPYCVQCFSEKFNPKCAGCHEVLVDTCLLALDKHWHPRCFTCFCCHRPLPNGEYYLVDDKPYDLDCHWEKRLDKRVHLTKERPPYGDF